MRILVINVNTTESMTRAIEQEARSVASIGTEITGVTPRFGPSSVEGPLESCLSAVGVLDVARHEAPGHDAVILAGFGDLGREALQEFLPVPVIDITDAAAALASLVGRSYAVVTTVAAAVAAIEDRLATNGLGARCRAVLATGVPVLSLEAENDSAVVDQLMAEAQRAVDDGAEVIVLGCSGMGRHGATMARRLGVPVIDGVKAAVQQAEAMCRQNLIPVNAGSYALGEGKALHGWPLVPSF